MSQPGGDESSIQRTGPDENAGTILAARERAENELVRTRDALRQSEERLRAVFEQAAIGIAVADLQGKFLQVNQRFSDIVGYTPAELRGLTFSDITHSDDLVRTREQTDRLLAGELAKLSYEKRYVRRDGTAFWSLTTVTTLKDAGGNATQFIGAIEDITARRRAEEQRSHLAAVIESSDDAVITKTLDGIIRSWNKGAERMFGYRADEAIGRPVTMLMPPERVSEEVDILGRLKQGLRIDHYETIRVDKVGRRLDVSLSVSPVRDAEGQLIGASKIARDISARKRIEEALRDETRILELLNSTGALMGSTLDLQSLVQSITDAATQISGAQIGAFFYTTVNPHGESFSLFALSGAPREAFEKFGLPRNTPLFEHTFRGGGVVRLPDVTKDPRYGKIAPHHGLPAGHPPVRSYLAVPVISRSGQVIASMFFGHSDVDVFTERTERIITGIATQAAVAIDNAMLYDRVKKASEDREQLLEAERLARAEAERIGLLKDEFLATLSHELRTPLNAILGWSQILLSREHADEEVREGLSVIERNTRVQTQLIEDLLDMSRIISGKIRLDVQQVDLQDVIRASVASVRHSADAKNIRLQVVLDPLAGPVRGDPARLQQCFWNLLSNAIKFTSRAGKVQVSLERVNSHLEVCVIDDGQGISAEFLPHLFQRFRQADASTTRAHGGLGLGLSIVKHLVELHGGKVRAKSPGESKGSTFCIELPVMVIQTAEAKAAREHPARHALAAPGGDHPSLEGITVLAVDDEPDARDLVKRVLQSCGARVLLAGGVAEALRCVREDRPDIIVSDIGMPVEDGFELIRQVRQLPADQGGRTPAAALTAFARAEDRTRALRAGYQMHVAKPVEPTELTAVVASLATRR